eukprot:gene13711-18391_t
MGKRRSTSTTTAGDTPLPADILAMRAKNKTNSDKKNQDGSLWKFIVVVVISIACYSFYQNYYLLEQKSQIKPVRPPSSKRKNATSRATKPSTTIPSNMSYDEYIVAAKKYNWLPYDPLEKFGWTLSRFSRVIDLARQNGNTTFAEFCEILEQERKFLLDVFKRSSDRVIDLTPTFATALQSTHEALFSSTKYILAAGEISMVTKSQILEYDSDWIYAPLKELLRLAYNNGTSVPYPHLQIDLNRRDEHGYSPIAKAVQYRFYALLSVMVMLGTDDLFGAYRAAVINGDDLAIGVLMKLSTKHLTPVSPEECTELLYLSTKLGFSNVGSRLAILCDPMMLISAQSSAEIKQEDLPIFNDYNPSTKKESNSALIKPPAGSPVSKAIMVEDAEVMDRSCVIDRVDISHLSDNFFYNNYVLLNKPIIIQSASKPPVTRSFKSIEDFVIDYGKIKIITSTIPYATLFGKAQVTETVETFVNGPNGMKAFTEKLLKAIQSKYPSLNTKPTHPTSISISDIFYIPTQIENDPNNTTSSEVDSSIINQVDERDFPLTLVNDTDIPRYVFSDHNQHLTEHMTRDIMNEYLKFSGVSTDNSVVRDPHYSSLLLDLMNTVSTIPTLEKKNNSDSGSNSTCLLFQSSLVKKENQTDSKESEEVCLLDKKWAVQFYLGPTFSGAPFHNHAPAFNYLVKGKKLWFITPPGRDLYSSLHPLEWIASGGAGFQNQSATSKAEAKKNSIYNDKICHIEQNEGEILYIPRHWSHQTLNVEDSMGFALEIRKYIH